MVEVANVFRGVDWGVRPDVEWATNVSDFIKAFKEIDLNSIRKIKPEDKILQNLAQSIVDVSSILAGGSFTDKPVDAWIAKISNLFDVFVNKVPDKNQLKRLQDFIEVLKEFSKSAEKIKDSGIEKLNKLTASVTIMSVIDDQRLQSVIRVLDNNKQNLSNVVSSSDGSQVQTNKQSSIEMTKIETKTTSFGKDKQDIMIEKFDNVIQRFDELLEYVVQSQTPENTGKEDTTK
jgi:hypothetical protein